jgi:hypothetical protein
MNEKELGKIIEVKFGRVGHQESCIGLNLVFSGKWGEVCTRVGNGYSPSRIKHTQHCKWTEADRDNDFAQTIREIDKILKDANVDYVNELLDKPVEVEFDDNLIKDWRILTEVI